MLGVTGVSGSQIITQGERKFLFQNIFLLLEQFLVVSQQKKLFQNKFD